MRAAAKSRESRWTEPAGQRLSTSRADAPLDGALEWQPHLAICLSSSESNYEQGSQHHQRTASREKSTERESRCRQNGQPHLPRMCKALPPRHRSAASDREKRAGEHDRDAPECLLPRRERHQPEPHDRASPKEPERLTIC